MLALEPTLHTLQLIFSLWYFLVIGPPVIYSGIKDLKLMKTTQSGFEDFHRDKYTTLPERKDRVLCGELFVKWAYVECTNVDFDCIWYVPN